MPTHIRDYYFTKLMYRFQNLQPIQAFLDDGLIHANSVEEYNRILTGIHGVLKDREYDCDKRELQVFDILWSIQFGGLVEAVTEGPCTIYKDQLRLFIQMSAYYLGQVLELNPTIYLLGMENHRGHLIASTCDEYKEKHAAIFAA